MTATALNSTDWLAAHCADEPQELVKDTDITHAWFGMLDGRAAFVKWYPNELRGSWAKTEAAIAASNLHPAIVSLQQTVSCVDGVLLIYERVCGENLASQEARRRFSALPTAKRAAVVVTASEALAAISDAGFVVVDWYEGNRIYDFDTEHLWLFDWELCREAGFFLLDRDSNYWTSKLMAPEEFVRGSRIDQQTLVFNLGRYALLTLPELADALADILARATHPARAGRYTTVRDYVAALRKALVIYG